MVEVELLLELDEVVNTAPVAVISIPGFLSGPKGIFGISVCGISMECFKHSSQIGFVLIKKKTPPTTPQIKHLNFFIL